jgi:tRNA pseudouridine38-40 synthase
MKKMLKVIIQFDGHKFLGWQIQKDMGPTVQEVFNKALTKVFKEKIKTVGSGRTDTGVHSLQHHVTFKPPFEIPTDRIAKALNSHLPDSVRAISCSVVTDTFRPTNDAISKEYHYFFSNLETAPPMIRHYMSNISYDLDLDAMKEACKLFVGKHNFNTFHCVGSDPSSTVRTISKCEIVSAPEAMSGAVPNHYIIKISGDGFLKQMVRLIVGAIWSVGRGKIQLNDISNALLEGPKKHLSPVAPPEGLFKISVDYSD